MLAIFGILVRNIGIPQRDIFTYFSIFQAGLSSFLLFYFIFQFLFSFLAALRLHCCARAFSSWGEWGLLFVAVRGLLIAVASPVAEHRLQAGRLSSCGTQAQQLWLAGSRAQAQQLWLAGSRAQAQQLQHTGSVVVARGLQSAGSVVVVHGLSCSVACGIFLDQGSNPCPLLWQADS